MPFSREEEGGTEIQIQEVDYFKRLYSSGMVVPNYEIWRCGWKWRGDYPAEKNIRIFCREH